MQRAMMELVYVAAAVLSLLSAGQSASLTSCERLTKPLENPSRDMMVGEWMYIAESSEFPRSKELGKQLLESVWVNATAGSQNNTLDVYQAQKVLGLCMTGTFTATFEDNSFHIENPIRATEVLLNTSCPDCLLIYQKANIGETTYRSLQFMSKRRSVSDDELGEFKKQVECLNLPAPLIMDPHKDIHRRCINVATELRYPSLRRQGLRDTADREVTSFQIWSLNITFFLSNGLCPSPQSTSRDITAEISKISNIEDILESFINALAPGQD